MGIQGMTVDEVQGFGRQDGHVEHHRGAECIIDAVPKVKISVIVSDDQVEQTIAAIVGAARTGRIGDGRIFVTPVEDVVRIRTGETDTDAL